MGDNINNEKEHWENLSSCTSQTAYINGTLKKWKINTDGSRQSNSC